MGKKCKIDVILNFVPTQGHGPYKLCVYQNCKFHDPRGRDSCEGDWPYKSYCDNALFLKKSFFLLPEIKQTNYVHVVMMTKEMPTKIEI